MHSTGTVGPPLAEAVWQFTDGPYVAARWSISTLCALQDMFTEVVWTEWSTLAVPFQTWGGCSMDSIVHGL